jgi:hypothetical protein
VRESGIYAARLLAIGVIGHENGKLMTMIETVEIHALLHFSKREHNGLSAA